MAVPSAYARVITEDEWNRIGLDRVQPEDREDVIQVLDALAKESPESEEDRRDAVEMIRGYADFIRASAVDLDGITEGEARAAEVEAQQVVREMRGEEDEEDEDDEDDEDEKDFRSIQEEVAGEEKK